MIKKDLSETPVKLVKPWSRSWDWTNLIERKKKLGSSISNKTNGEG
jgi:hypothetical protein